MHRATKGFTLIELLVVIAIIGILSSVVLASLNTAREKGANARRLSDIREIQKALEVYALANSGNYPNLGQAKHCTPSTWTPLETALAPYLATLPVDPAEDCGVDREYYVTTSKTDYKVMAHLPPGVQNAAPSVWDPARDHGTDPSVVDGSAPWAWSVYSSGAAAW